MAYSSEDFNKYNERVETAAINVSRGIRFLLCPEEGIPKTSDADLARLYHVWADNARAMDIALKSTWHSIAIYQPTLILPPDEDHYKPCRRMAAVLVERNVRGELSATPYLKGAVEEISANLDSCSFHSMSCPCHTKSGWTYANKELVNALSHNLEQSLVTQATGATGSSAKEHNVMKCACGACHVIRDMNGLSNMYEKSLDKMNSYGGDPGPKTFVEHLGSHSAISAAREMPGGHTDSGFVKNLFETVQGVKYDSKCPHGDPFYACMSCSH